MKFLRLLFLVLGVATLFAVVRSDAEGDNGAVSSSADATLGALDTAFSADQLETLNAKKETYQFQAEVNRVMDIIINSLYKAKEIFLRELISNASDALDKIRFLSISNPELLGETRDLGIRVSANKDTRTLTIRDSGIGMTKGELVSNLGTIAKSGTSNFAEALTSSSGDLNLIGQFGVGFYSIYLVADKVRVLSKHNDDVQYIWESTADGSYSIVEDPRGNTIGRGTEITLFLKEDADDYMDEKKLEELIKKYSEFITFPIYLRKTHVETIPIEDSTPDNEDEDVSVEDEESSSSDDEDGASKTQDVEVAEFERINSNIAIWGRSPSDVTEEEYQAFYANLIRGTTLTPEPLSWSHFKAEGEVEFKSIIYIPSEAPSDMYDGLQNAAASLRLYVRKVLITDELQDFLPKYLSFLRGVVDSDDLPLNVSRETLQQHKILKVMAKKIVRKALEMFRKLAESSSKKNKAKHDDDEDNEDGEDVNAGDSDEKDDKYLKFYEQYSKALKLGVIEDSINRSKLAKLLRFQTSKSEGKMISFDEYVERMQSWQKGIFYIAGESVESVEKSPFLERLTKKDVEVLYLVDPIDEYVMQHMGEYEDKRLQSVSKEGLTLGDENELAMKKREKAQKEKFKPLSDYLRKLYGSKKVSKVVVSSRLDTTPCVIVTGAYGNSANMERIMRAQTFADPSKLSFLSSPKTFEINARHPLILELLKLSEEAPEDEITKDAAWLLYDTALLQSGFTQDSPDAFADRMYRTLASSLNVRSLELEGEDDEEDDIIMEDISSSSFGEDAFGGVEYDEL